MKLSEMKQLLVEHDVQLTKSLGQSFLHDGNQLRRIVQAAGLKQTDRVLEVGPGLGPLTELLVREAGFVLAIEKDGRLVKILQQRLAGHRGASPGSPPARLQLIEADALDFLRDPQDWTSWKLVANLPYAVASPILVELAQASLGPERMVATLQLEVARRLMAQAGDADYGLLTLLVQLNYDPVEWFKIPAGCFFPEPDVDSACVVLIRRTQQFLSPDQRRVFTPLVKRSFSQRRKMMAKLLKADWPATTLDAAFAAMGLSLKARAEDVSLEQFIALTRILHERRNL